MLAEHLRGAAVGVPDVVYLSGGVGVGGGFLVGGQALARVSGGYGGEVGHLSVDPVHGEPCRCGARGCWETKIGENQVLRAVGRLPGGGPEAVADVVARAAAGDPVTEPAVADVAFWIGIGLGGIVNLCNPSVIVVDGVLAQVWRAFPDRVTAALGQASLAAPRAQMEIRVSGLGSDSSLIGAAELAFESTADRSGRLRCRPVHRVREPGSRRRGPVRRHRGAVDRSEDSVLRCVAERRIGDSRRPVGVLLRRRRPIGAVRRSAIQTLGIGVVLPGAGRGFVIGIAHLSTPRRSELGDPIIDRDHGSCSA